MASFSDTSGQVWQKLFKTNQLEGAIRSKKFQPELLELDKAVYSWKSSDRKCHTTTSPKYTT